MPAPVSVPQFVQCVVTLDADTLQVCARTAERIESQNRRRRRRNARGLRNTPAESLAARVMAYQSEAAVAHVLGLRWSENDDWTTVADVGAWDVRATNLLDGRLIVKPTDKDERDIVLVVRRTIGPAQYEFHVCGWFNAGEAKRHREWWYEARPGGGAWYVPRGLLRSLPLVSPLPAGVTVPTC